MTEEDVRILQDAALGRYVRLKQNLSAAETRLRSVGVEMSRIGGEIAAKSAHDLANFQFHSFDWFEPAAIHEMAGDVLRAESETQVAREEAIGLGVAIPD